MYGKECPGAAVVRNRVTETKRLKRKGWIVFSISRQTPNQLNIIVYVRLTYSHPKHCEAYTDYLNQTCTHLCMYVCVCSFFDEIQRILLFLTYLMTRVDKY